MRRGLPGELSFEQRAMGACTGFAESDGCQEGRKFACMSKRRSERGLTAACAVLGAALAMLLYATPADPQEQLTFPAHEFVGTLSCMSASCHGGSGVQTVSAGVITRRPYVHWFATEWKSGDGRPAYDPRARLERSDADPHALAAQHMMEPRFQDVLRRVSQRADGSKVEGTIERCAKCHDPLGLAEGNSNSSAVTPALSQWERKGMHGIGCESCHGAAGRWIEVHYERDVDREQLKQLGMIDTKNLLLRARQCTACHVGSADQDMNHDMIAAGHPPLRFELGSYEALIPRKHWDDQPRRMAEPEFEVQLWSAGRVAAAEAALALTESRARKAAAGGQGTGDGGRGTWPELAESDCFACHQPLRAQNGRLPLAKGITALHGVPPWQTWNLALAG